MELSERAIIGLEHWAEDYWDKTLSGHLQLEMDRKKRDPYLIELNKKLEKIVNAEHYYGSNGLRVGVECDNKFIKLPLSDLLTGGAYFFVDQDNQSVATRAYKPLKRMTKSSNQKDIISELYYPKLVTERDVLSLRNFGNEALEWLQQQLAKYGLDPLPKKQKTRR